MKISNKVVVRLLRDTANKIEKGECGMDDEELESVAFMFLHKRVNIEQICQHFGISRATLNRWQQCGKLPPFRKDSGGKDYMWLDEAEKSVEEWNKANG